MKFAFILIISMLTVAVFGQNEKKIKKEKVVTVDVKKEGESDRKVKIVTEADGESKVIEWTDNGEIPADIKKQLEEEGIEIELFEEGKMGEMIEIEVEEDSSEDIEKVIRIKKKGGEHMSDEDMVWIEDSGDKVIIKKEKYKIITEDGDGNEKVIEWDGEGEMPEEIKEHLKEHDMEIHEGHNGHGERIRIHKRGDRDMEIRKRKMRSGENVFFFDTENDRPGMKRGPKVFMGAQVGNHEKGAEILEILKDSPADNAKMMKGDVVTQINGAKTRSVDGFMGLLSHFDPGDEVEVTIWRDGAEKTIDLTFAERPDHFK